MTNKIYALIAIALLFSGCPSSDNNKNSGGDSHTNVSKTESRSYEFTENGCKTGKQQFDSLEGLCKGLQNNELNKGCAHTSRELYFEQQCPGQKFEKVTPVPPTHAPTPVPTPTPQPNPEPQPNPKPEVSYNDKLLTVVSLVGEECQVSFSAPLKSLGELPIDSVLFRIKPNHAFVESNLRELSIKLITWMPFATKEIRISGTKNAGDRVEYILYSTTAKEIKLTESETCAKEDNSLIAVDLITSRELMGVKINPNLRLQVYREDENKKCVLKSDKTLLERLEIIQQRKTSQEDFKPVFMLSSVYTSDQKYFGASVLVSDNNLSGNSTVLNITVSANQLDSLLAHLSQDTEPLQISNTTTCKGETPDKPYLVNFN